MRDPGNEVVLLPPSSSLDFVSWPFHFYGSSRLNFVVYCFGISTVHAIMVNQSGGEGEGVRKITLRSSYICPFFRFDLPLWYNQFKIWSNREQKSI